MGLGLSTLSRLCLSAAPLALAVSGSAPIATPVNTVAPSVSGTGAVGQTLTRTAGTWTGADSVASTWRRDGVAIPGQAGATYVVQSADAGTFVDWGETATNAGGSVTKGSNGIAIGAALATDGLYDGKNNTAGTVGGVVAGGTFPDTTLMGTAYPDLTLSGTTAQMTVNGAAQLQFGGTAVGDTMLKTAAGADFVVSWKLSDGGFSPPWFVYDYQNSTNFKYLNIALGDNGYTPHTVTAGNDVGGSFVEFGASMAQGNTIEVARSGSAMSLKRNGVTAGPGWTAAPVNNVVGWRSRAGGERWDDFLVRSASNPISISSASVDNDGYYVVTGGYSSPTPTAVQIRVFTADGAVSLNWESASGTIGSGAFSVRSASKAASSVQGGNARLEVRASNNTGIQRARLVAVPRFQSVFALEKGMNETNFSFPGLEYGRDLMLSASYSANGYNTTFVQKGLPSGTRIDGVIMIGEDQSGIQFDGTIQSYGTGNSLIRVIPPNRISATGVWNLTYPAAITASISLNGHGSVLSNSGGAASINFTDSSWPANDVSIEFSGGTNGALNFKTTLKRGADANPTRLYSDATKAAWDAMGVSWGRMMDPGATNLDTVTRTNFPADEWTGPVSLGAMSIEAMVAFCNAANLNLRLTVSHLWATTYIAGVAQYIAANLNPGLRVAVERSNEVWNFVTFSQGHDIARAACQDGLWNPAGNAAPITIRKGGVDTGAYPYYAETNGNLTQAFAAGEYLYANFGGWQVFRAKKNNAIGSSDGLGNAAAWEVAINNDGVRRALKRRYGELAREMFDAFDSAFVTAGFNARARVVRLLCWQASSGWEDAVDLLAWNDLWAHYDEFNVGPYWGGGFGGYELGNYDINYPGWGATEKALVATNPAAFLDAFFAIAALAVDGAVDADRDYKQGLARHLFDQYGVPMDGRRFGSYEAHWHWVKRGGWNSAIDTVFPTIVADPRFAGMFTRYAEGLKVKVGGTHCFYVRSQGPWAALPSYNWGFQQDDADVANDLFEALVAL